MNDTKRDTNLIATNLIATNIDAPAALIALYGAASPQGLGFLQARPGDLSREDAVALLEHARGNGHRSKTASGFDYVFGRPLKVAIDTREDGAVLIYRVDLLDRNAHDGAARAALVAAGAKVEALQ